MFDWLLKKNYGNISIDELRTAIEKPPEGALFVDVRRKEEWDAGHIDGFRHIPLAELEEHLETLKKYALVYLLCHSGGRSRRACDMLASAGHSGAMNVLGGITAWIARGYPIER